MPSPLTYVWSSPQAASGRFVIFDRDGTLTADAGYTYKTADFAWMPGALDVLAALAAARVDIFIATNQSGVGRGLFSLSDMEAFHQELVRRADQEAGAPIRAITVCPHNPTVAPACDCRKPKPGLIETIVRRFELDHTLGLVVGNSGTDMAAAQAASMASCRVGPAYSSLSDLQNLGVILDCGT